MAGSEPRSGGSSPQPHHSDWSRLEAAFLSGWRNFWQSVGKEKATPRASQEEADEEASTLTRLPVSGGHRPRRTEGRAGRGLTAPRSVSAAALRPFRAVSSPGSNS